MDTIPSLLLSLVDDVPERELVHTPAGKDGEQWLWQSWSLAQIRDQISGLARRLHALGVSTATPVAVYAETSHEWMAIDLAVLCLGGVTVGIYPSLTGQQAAWQLRHSAATALIVDTQERYDRLAPLLDELDSLVHVFSIGPVRGAIQLHPAEPDPDFLANRARRVRPEDAAAVVYTSGTTGEPKGAVLTHRCLVATARASQELLPMREGDRSILYLPMAHILQRIVGYRGLMEGAAGWFAPSLDDLPALLVQTRPTVLAVVPRVLEKIKSRAEATAAARGPVSAAVLGWAVAVGRSAAAAERQGRPLPRRLLLQRALAERLVYQTIRDRLGGALRLVVSGGAALSPDVLTWFEAIGISVREGWGLTETAGPATLNPAATCRPGSVGLPLPHTELRLTDDGELLVRGAGLFSGYLHDEEATAAAFTDDGFYRTGDLGVIDDDGYVWIIGRRKELLITAGGKNVAPVPIERKLEEARLIDQVVLTGDGRPFLSVLLWLDEDHLAEQAAAGSWPGSEAAWRTRQSVHTAVQHHIDAVNATLAPFESVKRFAFFSAPLSVAGGELTPTLKLRRAHITQKYAALIDALYKA
ncbi:MAG: long-chain acyl-CoA synthetase [Myxococcota bacterium]|jgi:long-chain acyl-CoA synthetase